MQFWIETKWKTLKLCPYYQFQKGIPYLAFMGKLWGVFSESFEAEIIWDIKRALYMCTVYQSLHDTENSENNLNIFIMIYVCDVGHMTVKYQLFLSISD